MNSGIEPFRGKKIVCCPWPDCNARFGSHTNTVIHYLKDHRPEWIRMKDKLPLLREESFQTCSNPSIRWIWKQETRDLVWEYIVGILYKMELM